MLLVQLHLWEVLRYMQKSEKFYSSSLICKESRLVTSLFDGTETNFRGNQRYPCQRGWSAFVECVRHIVGTRQPLVTDV
jgi:hypothetical protein